MEEQKYVYPLTAPYCNWSGGGEGARQAGFFTMAAADIEPNAIDNFKLNFPDSPIFKLDLSVYPEAILRDLAQLPKGTEHVTFTTAPCQGASMAGKFDPFNKLNLLMLNEPFRISREMPAAFVFENVEGLTQGRMQFLHNILMCEVDKWLKDYHIIEGIMLAGYYGVPQSRPRYIMHGIRKDLGVDPILPKPDTTNIKVISDVLDANVEGLVYGYHDQNFKPAYCVAPTLTKTENLKKRMKSGELLKLEIDEILRLCGYPATWKYVGSRRQIYARAGESVMPPFAKAIFDVIYQQLQKAGIQPYPLDELKEISRRVISEQLN